MLIPRIFIVLAISKTGPLSEIERFAVLVQHHIERHLLGLSCRLLAWNQSDAKVNLFCWEVWILIGFHPRRKSWVSSAYELIKVKNDHRSKFSNLSNWKEEAFFFFIFLFFQFFYFFIFFYFYFFRLLLSNCLNWKIYCDDHSSLWSTTAVQIYELFHICFTSFHSWREIWTQ